MTPWKLRELEDIKRHDQPLRALLEALLHSPDGRFLSECEIERRASAIGVEMRILRRNYTSEVWFTTWFEAGRIVEDWFIDLEYLQQYEYLANIKRIWDSC